MSDELDVFKKRYKLSQSTIEKLGYYVYILTDPRTSSKPFYVGRGKGNRVYEHVLGTLKEISEQNMELKERIHSIRDSENMVGHLILRHGLTKQEAIEIESAIIDFIGVEKLTNIVKGYHSEDRGIATLQDLKLRYEAEKAIFDEPVLLINININYHKGMDSNEFYEATRKHWVLKKSKAEKFPVVCSVFKGIIREVFEIDNWTDSDEIDGRYMFEGKVASDEIRTKYLDKSVKSYLKKGSSNPIRYMGE